MTRIGTVALALAGTVGCWSAAPDVEAPAPEAAPPPEPTPEPAPEPVPVEDLLYEVVIDMGEVSTGVRAYDDGRVFLGGGAPDDMGWHPERKLTLTQLEELHRLLAAPALRNLPEELPKVHDATGAEAVWRLRDGVGLRTVHAASYHGIRVPTLEAIDTLLRGARRLLDTRSRWIVHDATGTHGHDVPCDAIRVPELQGMTAMLVAVDLPAAQEARPGPVLLDVTFVTGTRSRHTVLHTDGRLFRTDADGATTVFQVPQERYAAAEAAMAKVDWSGVGDLCP
ncbi:MAG: hypothetical protein H6733_03335 [Alphaproteobacteria bacterium]|nr:hypothetical protein [Alphaproteobacteria bacterium]